MADAGDASSPAGAGSVAAGTSESVRPFVGRLRELGELSAVLVGSSAGRGGLFMVTGEPGIGKSRLMEEFAGLLADQGWRVLAGRCWEHGGAPAYWPWIQVVLVELFAELARVGHRIPLRGLSRPEVGTYISRVAARPCPGSGGRQGARRHRRQPLLRR